MRGQHQNHTQIHAAAEGNNTVTPGWTTWILFRDNWRYLEAVLGLLYIPASPPLFQISCCECQASPGLMNLQPRNISYRNHLSLLSPLGPTAQLDLLS